MLKAASHIISHFELHLNIIMPKFNNRDMVGKDGSGSRTGSVNAKHPPHLLLESDDLGDAVLDELPLGDDKLLPVLGRLVEEAGVHLSLLVLQGHVARQDVAVLKPCTQNMIFFLFILRGWGVTRVAASRMQIVPAWPPVACNMNKN
jgi:hypothetical protein